MRREVPARVTVLLLMLSLALCIVGIYRDEVSQVWQKATGICMECIGMG